MRSSNRASRLAACLLIVAALVSCSGPMVTSVGNSNDMVIVHATGEQAAAELLEGIMRTNVTWLLEEPTFKPSLAGSDDTGELRRIRHIMLVGSTEDRDLAGLARQAVGRTGADEPVRLRIAEDVWAKRQVVGVVMGPTEEAVLEFLRENRERVVEQFEAAAVRRLASGLREVAEEAGMDVALEERFGWSLCPPSEYDFFTTHEKQGFVFFRRTRPDRTIFLHWEQGNADYISEQFVVSRRQELAGRYYDGDEIEWKRPLEVDEMQFLDRDAVRLSGWWGNRTLVGGGPFRTYCFYEPSQQRVYMLDISLFAPSFDKVAPMRNLDAIAHTFETAPTP